MFRFFLLVHARGTPAGILAARFALGDLPRDSDNRASVAPARPVALDVATLRAVSGELLVFPEVRSEAERDLLRRLHGAHPTLGDASAPGWSIRFSRELDMTTDGDLFVDAEAARRAGVRRRTGGAWRDNHGAEYLPVLEGRMVQQFDCSAKAYRTGQGRTATWVRNVAGTGVIEAHYFVRRAEIMGRAGVMLAPRAGFCDVTGHANERSVLAALVPRDVVCGNKVPTCRFDGEDVRLHLLWVAIANSFVVDWLVRRRLSTTLNYFIWNQVPFPRVSPNSPLGRTLATSAAQLSCRDAEGAAWMTRELAQCGLRLREPPRVLDASERLLLRARIDSTVARLFGLGSDDVRLILDDFPLVARRSRGNSQSLGSAILGELARPSRRRPLAAVSSTAGSRPGRAPVTQGT